MTEMSENRAMNRDTFPFSITELTDSHFGWTSPFFRLSQISPCQLPFSFTDSQNSW